MDNQDVSGHRVAARISPAAYKAFFRASPTAYLVMRADDLVMLDANQPWLDSVGLTLSDVVGRHVFDVFPERSDDTGAQVGTLQRIMLAAIRERRQIRVDAMRYDIPTANGDFEVRWWNSVETPVVGADGRVSHLLHASEDVTDLVRARSDLGDAERARRRVAARVTLQAELALTLTSATTVGEVERLVIDRGASLLGADGGAVFTRAPDGGWRVTLPPGVDGSDPGPEGWVPYDSPMPSATAARRGRRVLLPDREAGLAFHPDMANLHQRWGCDGYASFPLSVGARQLGALAVWWSTPHTCTAGELELLEGVAAQCALALDRVAQAEAQRGVARQLSELAESLQSALMAPPPPLPGLEVAVRYRSADDVAKVGGDWYDAFVQPDGASTVVVGDVVGHDHIAAGKMGQIRGVLRALAFDTADQPHGSSTAAILTRYEEVASALHVSDLATVVLARIEVDQAGHDGHAIRWSNAGAPPPLLVHDDGSVAVLDEKHDLMLGVDASLPRHEHVTPLPAGATLLLYTDGLVEGRTASIADGIADLTAVAADLAGAGVETLADGILERLGQQIGEDDVALLAVRRSG